MGLAVDWLDDGELNVSIFYIDEKESATYTGYLRKPDDSVITLAEIDTITLTLYDENTGTFINSRNDQDILNANNVTIHATSGLLTWDVQPDDNALVGTDLVEVHVAVFEWARLSGAGYGKHEMKLHVRNLVTV